MQAFQNILGLKTLDIRYNHAAGIPAGTLNSSTLRAVRIRCVSGVQTLLRGLFSSSNRDLERVSITEMPDLSEIQASLFRGPPRLKSVAMSHNPILHELKTNTFDGAFLNTRGQTRVDLLGSAFTKISRRAFNFDAHGISNLAVVNIGSATCDACDAECRLDNSLSSCCGYHWLSTNGHFLTSSLRCNGTDFGTGVANLGAVSCCNSYKTTVASFQRSAEDVQVTSFGLLQANTTQLQVQALCTNASWELNNSTGRWVRDASDTTDTAPASVLTQVYAGLVSTGNDTCVDAAACPEGYRSEPDGSLELLDCEPWTHALRPSTYATEHFVGDRSCFPCGVVGCADCSDDPRECARCLAEGAVHTNDSGTFCLAQCPIGHEVSLTTDNDGTVERQCRPVPQGIERVKAEAEGNDAILAALLSVGGLLFVTLVMLVWYKVTVRRLKHRPIDVSQMQRDLLQKNGILAATNIDPNTELGVNFVLDRVVSTDDVECDGFRHCLGAVLRKAAPKITATQLQKARYVCGQPGDDSSLHVLVVLAKSHQRGIAESIVRAIQHNARTLGTFGMIVDASVAVPQRVPREIPRSSLTRIADLGSGAFGVVRRYQLHARGRMTVDVAAKSVKPANTSILSRNNSFAISLGLGSDEHRQALMQEAALGALLDHRNVVATIGICTAPRDVPALLLLSLCSEGTLETRVNAATAISMAMFARLTYCAQILQGLGYIATRRIVHRDVAARNVLLDATLTCKISDFGMASALVDHSKEYIREKDQLAIRWASIEVIREGKYSVQSDVWAFGVLAYEVFACGVLPYADSFDNLTEISEFVKHGGMLGRPNAEACPLDVYEELIMPCFATDPSARPAFGALYEVAVMHGAEEDDEALAERALARQSRRAFLIRDTDDRSLLGPSVHHLDMVLVPAVTAAVAKIQKDESHPQHSSFRDLAPGDTSIWHTVYSHVKPASADAVCPQDGKMGCGYVDTLTGTDNVGQADALLSYSWGYLLSQVSAALSAWTERNLRNPKRTYIWICSLCLNQHRLGGGEAATPDALAKEFGDRVKAIGLILPMLEPWHDPGYVKRAWCLFELYTSIQHRTDVEIDIILSPDESQSFRDRINRDGTDAPAVDEALAHVKSENAEASVQADLDAIRELIQTHSGGFGTLNNTVKQFLQRWFVAQGGVRVGRKSRATLPLVHTSPTYKRFGSLLSVSTTDCEPDESCTAAATLEASQAQAETTFVLNGFVEHDFV